MGKEDKNPEQSEIKEFVRKEKEEKQKSDFGKKMKELPKQIAGWFKGKWQLWFVLLAVLAIVAVVAGILWCKVPVVAAILVVILEVALSVCLGKSPLWLHACVVIVNIILGAIFHFLVFMIVVSVVYAAGIWALHKKAM